MLRQSINIKMNLLLLVQFGSLFVYIVGFQHSESSSPTETAKDGQVPFLMPNITPTTPESYLCTPIKVDTNKTFYIIGYGPHATMNVAHHMLLYGCLEPGIYDEDVWNCGEMSKNKAQSFKTAGICHGPSQIIYAWARNAPKLELPDGIGFKIGKDSKIKYMVLQVHYANIELFKDGKTDDSGVVISYTAKTLNNLAGVIVLGTGGSIPPMQTQKMEVGCDMTENKTIYPFAYRTHTHTLGKVVSGYRVRRDKNGIDQWTVLGKRNPLTPQMFYPVENTEPINSGDRLAARCTMKSNRNHITKIGNTQEDEMCNFYLMYYVKNNEPLEKKFCFTRGPPDYYWNNGSYPLNNIPDLEASSL